jgi:hypothetical protein
MARASSALTARASTSSTDTEGFVASWNAGAEKIKGYAPVEIIGHTDCPFAVAFKFVSFQG